MGYGMCIKHLQHIGNLYDFIMITYNDKTHVSNICKICGDDDNDT